MRIQRIAACVAALSLSALANADMEIRAVDEEGKPVPGAVALVVSHGAGFSSHNVLSLGDEGRVEFGGHDDMQQKSMDVWVAAPGLATAKRTVTENLADAKVAVTLGKGVEASFRIVTASGRPLPDNASVFCYDEEMAGYSWWSRDADKATFGQHLPTRVAPDVFVFNVPEDCGPLFLGVDAPGTLRGWASPTAYAVAGVETTSAAVTLPAPGALEATFAGKEGAEPGAYYVAISRTIKAGEKRYGVDIASTEVLSGTEVSLSATDLAPGNYTVEGGPGVLTTRYQGNYTDSQRATVASDRLEKVRMVYEPFDAATLKGDYDVTVKLKGQDGKPAAGVDWVLSYRDDRAGNIEVAAGTTAADGLAEMKGLAGGSAEAPQFRLGRKDSDTIGSIHLNDGGKTRMFEMTLPPAVGDAAPDIALTDIATGETIRLADLKGKVVFLDFWATWCGPCQEPMKHNSEILARRAKDWEGKAVILGASCDDDVETLKKHVAKNAWDNVRQMWCEEGGAGWQSTPMRTYGISGVPTAFLIGKDGKIAWRGHPGSYDVEGSVDKLLAGK